MLEKTNLQCILKEGRQIIPSTIHTLADLTNIKVNLQEAKPLESRTLGNS